MCAASKKNVGMVVGAYINAMETTSFDFNFYLYQAVNSTNTHKHIKSRY